MQEHKCISGQAGLSPQQTEPLDGVIEFLLIALLVFMPLAFGAVQAWSEQVVIILSGLVAFCFAIKLLISRQARLVSSWTYIPIILFILFILFQLVPLPTGLVEFISPHTVQLKTRLLSDSQTSETLPRFMSISFYPHATKHQLRLLLGGIVVYIVVLNVFRSGGQIKRLLGWVAAIGGIVAAIALLQNLFGNDKIYGLVPIRNGQVKSGPFVNHSHFGQFINLSIGAALALLAVKLQEKFSSKKATTPAMLEYLGSKEAGIIWLMVLIVILGITTIFTSLSRGGIVSMLVATSFTTVVIIRQKNLNSHAWIIGLIALAAFVCILYTGFDAVYERLATLKDPAEYGSRWQILTDLSALFRKFWLTGTGLGTHLVVYPMFSHLNTPAIVTHAENEYAQLFEETGAIGLGLFILFAAIICKHYIRHIRRCSASVQYAAYGIGFGLAAVAVHSLADFGQHLPANAFLSTVFCALLVTLSNPNRKSPIPQPTKALWPRLIVVISVCAVSIWAIVGANNFRNAEAQWKKVAEIENKLVEQDWRGSDSEYAELIAHAEQASNYEPENIEYRYWWNAYRWQFISRQKNPDTGAVVVPEESMATVEQIVDNLRDSHTLCPTYGLAYCLRGQLELFILENPNGADSIRTAFELAPYDAATCFVAGFLDVEQGRLDDSLLKFKRAAHLKHSFFDKVISVYTAKARRPDLALAVAADKVRWLQKMIRTFSSCELENKEELIEQAQTSLQELLEKKCDQPQPKSSDFASLAAVYRQQNKTSEAIELYRRALSQDYGRVTYRLQLARSLADAGHINEAMHEAKLCLRFKPESQDARELVAELSVHPCAFEAETNIPYSQTR